MAGRLIAYCKTWIGIYQETEDTSDTDLSTNSTNSTSSTNATESPDTDIQPDDNSTATTADINDDIVARVK
jgi:hypothetical protein